MPHICSYAASETLKVPSAVDPSEFLFHCFCHTFIHKNTHKFGWCNAQFRQQSHIIPVIQPTTKGNEEGVYSFLNMDVIIMLKLTFGLFYEEGIAFLGHTIMLHCLLNTQGTSLIIGLIIVQWMNEVYKTYKNEPI